MWLLAPILYGVSTLFALWSLSGGDPALLWSRQLSLGVVLFAMGLSALVVTGRARSLRPHSASLMLGAASALGMAVPVVALIWMGRHLNPESVPFLHASLDVLRPPHFGHVLVGALLVGAGHEMISRGFLSPAWGLGGVAFLDAVAVGFGLQLFVPFLVIGICGYLWGILAQRFGLATAVLSRTLWSLIVLSALYAL